MRRSSSCLCANAGLCRERTRESAGATSFWFPVPRLLPASVVSVSSVVHFPDPDCLTTDFTEGTDKTVSRCLRTSPSSGIIVDQNTAPSRGTPSAAAASFSSDVVPGSVWPGHRRPGNRFTQSSSQSFVGISFASVPVRIEKRLRGRLRGRLSISGCAYRRGGGIIGRERRA